LEIVPSPTVETLETAKALAHTEPQLERRTLLLSLVALLAGRYFDKEFVREMFRKEIDLMQTNTFFDDWLEEAQQKGIEKGIEQGIEKGIEQGIEQGREEEAQALLLRLLEHRFEAVPVRLVLRIQSLSLEELNRLFELTLTATSLQEVEQAANNGKQS
jgi:predicted transposase YdaD